MNGNGHAHARAARLCLKELMSEGKRPPAELSRQLMLLHSYVLVKVLVKLGDHPGAARMLNRVAKNISKFPAHVVRTARLISLTQHGAFCPRLEARVHERRAKSRSKMTRISSGGEPMTHERDE